MAIFSHELRVLIHERLHAGTVLLEALFGFVSTVYFGFSPGIGEGKIKVVGWRGRRVSYLIFYICPRNKKTYLCQLAGSSS